MYGIYVLTRYKCKYQCLHYYAFHEKKSNENIDKNYSELNKLHKTCDFQGTKLFYNKISNYYRYE